VGDGGDETIGFCFSIIIIIVPWFLVLLNSSIHILSLCGRGKALGGACVGRVPHQVQECGNFESALPGKIGTRNEKPLSMQPNT
jgi:hypothetical protein